MRETRTLSGGGLKVWRCSNPTIPSTERTNSPETAAADSGTRKPQVCLFFPSLYKPHFTTKLLFVTTVQKDLKCANWKKTPHNSCSHDVYNLNYSYIKIYTIITTNCGLKGKSKARSHTLKKKETMYKLFMAL